MNRSPERMTSKAFTHVAIDSWPGGPRRPGQQPLYDSAAEWPNGNVSCQRKARRESSARSRNSMNSWNGSCSKRFLPVILRRSRAPQQQNDLTEMRVQIGIARVEPGRQEVLVSGEPWCLPGSLPLGVLLGGFQTSTRERCFSVVLLDLGPLSRAFLKPLAPLTRPPIVRIPRRLLQLQSPCETSHQ
jgi:hypothetical protein